MRAVDTNILARYLVRDDPAQVALADAALAESCFLPITVLLEITWLLASRYATPRAKIAEALEAVLQLPTVATEDDSLVTWAIERFRAGADFADMIHIMVSRRADSFISFDKRLARQAGPDAPLPIETLA